MHRMIGALLLAACMAAPASAQSEATVYMLCRVGEDEALVKIAPGEFRMFEGDAWGANVCADGTTLCQVSPAGRFTAMTGPEVLAIEIVGGQFSWTNGTESQAGACGQVEEPQARTP